MGNHGDNISRHVFPEPWRRGVYEAIARRRDIRSFLLDPIPPQVLARILSAAHQAGSVGFSQPWNFIIIEDQELRKKIHAHVDNERLQAAETFKGERREKYLSYKLEGILDAPLNICVTCDRERFGPAIIGRNTMKDTDIYSTCTAIQNLWLAARAEGIGVGWVSILQPERLRDFLGIPEHVVPVGYLCVGMVGAFPLKPTLETSGWLPRVPLTEIVFSNRWGEKLNPGLIQAMTSDEPTHTREENLPSPQKTPPAHKGLLVVYTGHGKGKTTAAFGLAFRALGRGLKVGIVQFIKGKWRTGEYLFAETIPNLDFFLMGRGFTWESDDLSKDKKAAQEAWSKAKDLMGRGHHDIVILDELTYCIHYNFIDQKEIIETLSRRPAHVHVVVTGRNAPDELKDLADLVTEMKSIKHPFEKGVPAQAGIDF